MAAVALATHLTHSISFITSSRRREQVCTERNDHLTKSIPALDESPRGYYTQAVRRWFVHSINKSGQSFCSRHAWTDKASNPRGYNTGNEPPSCGPEDGNIYDQETIEISTNKVSNYQLGSPDEDHRRANFTLLKRKMNK